MVKKVKYSTYKRVYNTCKTVPGSYDSRDKTVEIIIPEIDKSAFKNFSADLWEVPNSNCALSRAHLRCLKGFNISVRQWNTGDQASYRVEAYGDPFASLRGKMSAPTVDEDIPGYGLTARDRAISRALELAATGLYSAST